jgi:hypothetical protein
MQGRHTIRTQVLCALAAGLAAVFFPAASSAQTAAPNQGPMIVERVHSGFMVAPDVKITEVDHHTSELVGGYGGWLTDDAIFVGGGGYWLANNTSDRSMAYGGLVVQWMAHTNDKVGYSLRGLVGGGQARLTDTIVQPFPVPLPLDGRGLVPSRNDITQLIRFSTRTANVRFHEGFFLAEPDVDVMLRVARHMRIAVGAGYRFVGTDGPDSSRLRGATGSIALQIGGGS